MVHFLETLNDMGWNFLRQRSKKELGGMRVAPYYGCMLANPPSVTHKRNYAGIMEDILRAFNANPVLWPHMTRCCGTFLSATKPRTTTESVNQIVGSAIQAGAECLITACAMCQLNLEIRCSLSQKIPTFHFTEILALMLGSTHWNNWFNYHIVDPRPLLRLHGII